MALFRIEMGTFPLGTFPSAKSVLNSVLEGEQAPVPPISSERRGTTWDTAPVVPAPLLAPVPLPDFLPLPQDHPANYAVTNALEDMKRELARARQDMSKRARDDAAHRAVGPGR